MDPQAEIARLERRCARERQARKRAEQLLERKSHELHALNQELSQASARLNVQVLQRTMALETERSRAQREARFLSTILDSVTQGISVFDERLRLKNWNDNLATLLGLPAELLTAGRPIMAFLEHCAARGDYGPGEAAALARARLDALRGEGRRELIREVRHRANGRYIEMLARRLPDGGVVTTYADISAQKRTERTLKQQKQTLRNKVAELEHLRESLEQANRLAEAAVRAKSRFIAMISHDIRTPVNGLLGTLTLLRDSPMSAEQEVWLSHTMASAEQLRGLLADLIDLSQADAGALRLRRAPLDLHASLEEIAAIWAAAARHKGLIFESTLAADLPRHVLGDSGRIRQVLENLLSNAVKYTQHGGVALAAEPVEDGVRFKVSDTGSGISDADRSGLFEDFTRLDRTAKTSKGHGLGLAIARHLVELMGGTITLDSEPDIGSSFCVILPLAAATSDGGDAAPSGDWAERRLRTTEGQAPRVLVAEDLETNQLVIRAYLERMGAQVSIVNDGREALDAVAREPFDLVIMDLDMPEMDGLDATRHIRALPTPAAKVPIVVATAYADQQTKHRTTACEVQGYVEKPLRPDALGQVAQQALGAHLETAALNDALDLDGRVLRALMDDAGPDVAPQLLRMAQLDLEQVLRDIEDASTAPTLARATHKLMSLAPNFGAMALGQLASDLNRHCRTLSDHDSALAPLAEHRREILRAGAHAIAQLAQHLETSPSPAAY